MKFKLSRPSFLTKSLRLAPYRVGWLAFDATGASVSMGLGMVLATVMPQISLAQEPNSVTRQQAKFARKDELPLKSEDKMQKGNLPTGGTVAAIPNAEVSKNGRKLAEVVIAVPKLNEKRLSPEELRELRQQLLHQR